MMSKGTHNPYYQKRIEQVVNKSLSGFKWLSIFRIDLRSLMDESTIKMTIK